MKNKIDIKSLALGGLLGAVMAFSIAAATPSGSRANWEYQIVDAQMFVPLMNAMNQRAKDGWELMEVHPPLEAGNQIGFAVMRRATK